MSRRIRAHLRTNVVGYVAIFLFAIGGTAYATHPGGANTIDSGDIINGQVTEPDIATNAVRSAEILNDTVAGGGLEQQDLQGASVGGSEIRNNAVASGEVENDSLGSDDLGPNSVTNSEMEDNAVGNAELADSAVGSAEVIDDTLAGGGLVPADLAANSVGTSEIQTDGVAASEIQNDSIDSGEIVDFQLSNQDIGVLFAEVNADATLANSSGGVTSVRVGAVGAGNYEVDFGRNVAACTAVASLGNATTGVQIGEVSAVDRSTQRRGRIRGHQYLRRRGRRQGIPLGGGLLGRSEDPKGWRRGGASRPVSLRPGPHGDDTYAQGARKVGRTRMRPMVLKEAR